MAIMQKIIRRRSVVSETSLLSTVTPLMQRIYSARGVADERELQYKLAQLHKPTFKGLTAAVNLLADAVVAQAKLSSSVTLMRMVQPVVR